MKLLRITLDGRESPNYVINNAFKDKFSHVSVIWWQRFANRQVLGQAIMNTLKSQKFDVIWMQLQRADVFHESIAQELAKHALVFNWTGDVRENLKAYTDIGRYCVTLFTNETDVEKMRRMGLRSDYLQCGYDHIYFNDKGLPREPTVAFLANNYDGMFPLSKERNEMVQAMREEFGDKFLLYGNGWNPPSLGSVNDQQEAHILNKSLLSISMGHFKYKRYYSRRLLVEMACGSMVLSHDYPDYEKDWIDGKHFVIWKDIKDLIDKTKYYLANPKEARKIAIQGNKKAEENCKWGNRVDEFLELVKKYKR